MPHISSGGFKLLYTCIYSPSHPVSVYCLQSVTSAQISHPCCWCSLHLCSAFNIYYIRIGLVYVCTAAHRFNVTTTRVCTLTLVLFAFVHVCVRRCVGSFATKSTPVTALHFTRRNLLLASGPIAKWQETSVTEQFREHGNCIHS